MKRSGYATTAGTEGYRKRFEQILAPEHFRQSQNLWMSSIGLGTYLGNYDAETDQHYVQAIVRAVASGCNVIDSAINYRFQRSERAIGTAIEQLGAKGFGRDEIVIATKGGFIPYDAAPPKDARRYFEDTFVKPGIAQVSDLIANCHCMTPAYILNQLDCSLANLNLETIDIYYLHNPETQLGKIARSEFNDRLLKAFEALEGAAAAGKIRMYGTATWNGYRNDPTANDYLSLAEVVAIAERAGGKANHFKAVQLPLNLGMIEALSLNNQEIDGRKQTTLEAAQSLGLTIMCSAAVLQGQLTHDLPNIIAETFDGLTTDGQRALQFVRSTPGVTSALVGMKQIAHVDENLHVASLPPASWEKYSKLFQGE
jgi:aryl-alcohol dehydrogenase-like predicted oxidoreductase